METNSSTNIEELEFLGLPLFEENAAFEAKSALGQDGRGQLPRDFWPTYSAMANTDGGHVILGLREVRAKAARGRSRFDVVGIPDIEAVQKHLWDGLNNKKQVSRNLLGNGDVRVLEVGGKKLLDVRIPRALRTERPVYLYGNPLDGTYRRNYEGDYRCDEGAVRRMLADAEHDSLDARILPKFGLDDLDPDTLSAYRNQFRSTSPTHPFLAHDDLAFLRSIGGYARNRETDEVGLTLAGLLMFGKYQNIVEAIPTYFVDYREVQDPNKRWSDRIAPDGTWSGNLFDFYRRVNQKLVSGLRVPFQIVAGQRVDDTHVHEALREALVNALIHADYSGGVSVLVMRHKDRFEFRNPGRLRVPISLAFEGNHSDCRNRNLQNMFMLAGAAEKAGSGLPKILRAWTEQQWFPPRLSELDEPEQALLVLLMVTLLPEESLGRLRVLFGSKMGILSSDETMALSVADVEGSVTNARMQNVCKQHPRDITKLLRGLVDNAFLEPHGATNATYYTLVRPAEEPVTEAEVEEASPSGPGFSPLVEGVRKSLRSDEEAIREAILEVAVDYRTIAELAETLNRSVETIRRHVPRLLAEELIEPRYRSNTHPNQAYRRKVGA